MRLRSASSLAALCLFFISPLCLGAPLSEVHSQSCEDSDSKHRSSTQFAIPPKHPRPHSMFADGGPRHCHGDEVTDVSSRPSPSPEDAWASGHPYQAHDTRIELPSEGFTYPMERMKIIRGFDDDRCWHQGIDIYADKPHFGIGTPVLSITRARIVALAVPEKNPWAFGHPDRRRGHVTRKGVQLPRILNINGYGKVFPFSRRVGRAKTGTMVVTQSLHPEYRGYRIRYMHLAAIRPDLKPGDIVEAGEELGLLGGTGIRESIPHLHMDIENRREIRQDVARLIGLAQVVPSGCRGINKAYIARKRRHRHVVRRGDSLWKIARKHKTTEKRLMSLNRIRNPRALRIGQRLRVR